ncbi:MAG: thiolase [Betaproteobacteria bacterium]|nr:thiolase [Betaproteobacteria bacterium]
MNNLKRGSVAIVGAAESDLGAAPPDTSPLDLIAQATHRALEDAGMKLSDIDAAFVSSNQMRMVPQNVCEYLGLQPRYFDSTNIGGASSLTQLAHAQAAIEAGLCTTALITYGSTQRLASRALASPREYWFYESVYRPLLPVGGYALVASRHMFEYGTTREHLAQVAVAAREWALLNPKAWEKKPLTVDEVLNARIVSHPLGVRDCCLVNDGGGAIIVTSAERARALKKPPVYVLGVGQSISHRFISCMRDFTTTAAVHSGKEAYAMSGLSAKDVDVAELYDCFTITPILFLEDLGFCPKGEGGRFVSDGNIAPGGNFPVNTSGGGLSYCHPGHYGILLLVEAVRQLRGECGPRQVKDCEIALANGNGGEFATECTVLLGGPSTV